VKRRDFCKGVSIQTLAATTLPAALLAENVRVEEVTGEPASQLEADLVSIFTRHMLLDKVKAGETFLFYSRPGFGRPEYISASLAAAKALGANAFALVATSSGGPSGDGTTVASTTATVQAQGGVQHVTGSSGSGGLLQASLVGADIVYGQIPLYTEAHNAALASGTRTLMVSQGPSTLKRMYPDDDVINRTYAGAKRMWQAKEIRVTDDQGSDFTLRKDGRKGHAQVGISGDRGRWDHWPSGLVACAPLEDKSEGVYIINPGDILLGLQQRCRSQVKITMEAGRLTKIEGGTDADMIRERLELFQNDKTPGKLSDPFRIAHAGWGTEHRAQWHVMGMDSESLYGTIMVSIGRNMFDSMDRYAGLGGNNYTPVHIDICCRNKKFYLDGDLITDNNKIVPSDLA
jgi:2,5-dihydroxypyridine 5,6-dioxygenase